MSYTPRTDDAEYECVDEPVVKLGSVDAEFARQLERELNAANERIKRLEEAGDRMVNEGWNEPHLAAEWRKAKEAKP
jgi:hypothetical protein